MDNRFYQCEVCEMDAHPDKVKRYTREELIAHLEAAHHGWALCKGCDALLTQYEYTEGKGWCRLCVYLCYDCMDTDKYPA